MEISIISKETIKPSSPTPSHLKTFSLSLWDKIHKNCGIAFTTYYSIKHPNEIDYERIKLALAETLSRFYPLAGRPAGDDKTIDCNDMGVLFVTARVKCRLTDLLNDTKILPPCPSVDPAEEDDDVRPAQMGIQLNIFECGGIALSILASHYFVDATSIVAFLKCWSEISLFGNRGDHYPVAYPSFPGVEMFATNDDDDDAVVTPFRAFLYKSNLAEGEKCVMQRFVFDKDSVHTLREKARCEDVLPTRVEAVSMFIWKQCMAAAAQIQGVRQPSTMTVVAELRRRMAPLLSDNSFGNIFLTAAMQWHNTTADDDISGLITLFRTSMQEDILDAIPTLMKNKGAGREKLLQYIEKLVEKNKETDLNTYVLTSWCRLGFNDIDFGWGKPAWFSLIVPDEIPPICKNLVMIIDGQGDEKIELWIILEAREMNALENNQEFLAYASLNPPIII